MVDQLVTNVSLIESHKVMIAAWPITICSIFSCSQKHQDAFASAFGFFLLGFDWISRYPSPQNIRARFFGVTDPVISFFNVCMCVYLRIRIACS